MSTAILILSDIQCCNCGIVFGMTQEFVQWRRNDHRNFYCPNGHQQHFPGKSEAELLRDRLAEKERALTAAKCAEANERMAREKTERKFKRTCARIHRGVCPCCNRTFLNLQRHMNTKHPDYRKEGSV